LRKLIFRYIHILEVTFSNRYYCFPIALNPVISIASCAFRAREFTFTRHWDTPLHFDISGHLITRKITQTKNDSDIAITSIIPIFRLLGSWKPAQRLERTLTVNGVWLPGTITHLRYRPWRFIYWDIVRRKFKLNTIVRYIVCENYI
jgi:hypothetical protein